MGLSGVGRRRNVCRHLPWTWRAARQRSSDVPVEAFDRGLAVWPAERQDESLLVHLLQTLQVGTEVQALCQALRGIRHCVMASEACSARSRSAEFVA